MDAINVYVTLRYLDDPRADVDAILDRFYADFFGPAALPMRRFFDTLEARFTDPAHWRVRGQDQYKHLDADTSWTVMGPHPIMEYLAAKVRDAEHLVAGVEPYQSRVALIRKRILSQMLTSRRSTLSRLSHSPASSSRYDNLVVNSDFEDNIGAWTRQGRLAWVADGCGAAPGCMDVGAEATAAQTLPVLSMGRWRWPGSGRDHDLFAFQG